MRAAPVRGALVWGHCVWGLFGPGYGAPAAAVAVVVHADVSRLEINFVAPLTP